MVATGFIWLGVEFRGPRLARFWFAGLGDRRVRLAGSRLTWFRAQCAPSGCGSGIAGLGARAHHLSERKLCLSAVNQRTFIARFELSDTPGELALKLAFLCGHEGYVALTLICDLAKRNFAEKHHII